MAITVQNDPTLPFSRPEALFETRAVALYANGVSQRAQYDVTSDGQRFLINTATRENAVPPIEVILNWTALIKP
jgi:hypothetical protein